MNFPTLKFPTIHFQRLIFSTLKIFNVEFFNADFSTLKVFDDDFSNVEYFSRRQNIFRAPKNREVSISLDRCRVNAKDMLLAKNKSSAIDQGIGATFDFLKKI